jgi:tripeptidyl-peptidase I
MSSVIALVNDALLAAGRPVLGFLNVSIFPISIQAEANKSIQPWIYSGGYKAFTDIVGGSSAGCNTGGFAAQPGWDAVTGFGTPYFPAILENLGISQEL